MATIETEVTANKNSSTPVRASRKGSDSIIDRVLRLFSSVRFGIIMLLLVLACCMIGMLIMQENVQGFREYYENLTPSQRLLYGTLGFFDIYHSWYFTLLLAVTGLNIILSSIDRFPAAWRFVRKPKLAALPDFTRVQMFSAETEVNGSPQAFAEKVAARWRKTGLRPRISKEGERITVFAQRNAWNRLGAYVVHVALLLILAGGFMTSRYGIGGAIEIIPGESSNSFTAFDTDLQSERSRKVELPFAIECTDLQQQLITPEGGLDVMNTIDWLSFIRIKDGVSETPALVHLNTPFDYRGYRFFQSSFEAQGYARQITVRFEPAASGSPREITLERNGSADVEGIGRISYVGFYSDFTMERGKPATATGEYNNPVAELQVTGADGKPRRAFAFNAEMAEHAPEKGYEQQNNPLLFEGNKVFLKDFEKVATSHTLTVQYDPGRMPVYVGFTLLFLSLCGVFFFSHQRVWAVIEPDGKRSKVYFAGNTNRNRPTFEGRFNLLVKTVTERGDKHE
jgi:cytochrome c biogenesis protein